MNRRWIIVGLPFDVRWVLIGFSLDVRLVLVGFRASLDFPWVVVEFPSGVRCMFANWHQ